jgi:hypothetical protein
MVKIVKSNLLEFLSKPAGNVNVAVQLIAAMGNVEPPSFPPGSGGRDKSR